jgi:hypothetical protein
LPYWQALAQQGLGMKDAASRNFTRFIARRADSDPLAANARRQMQ